MIFQILQDVTNGFPLVQVPEVGSRSAGMDGERALNEWLRRYYGVGVTRPATLTDIQDDEVVWAAEVPEVVLKFGQSEEGAVEKPSLRLIKLDGQPRRCRDARGRVEMRERVTYRCVFQVPHHGGAPGRAEDLAAQNLADSLDWLCGPRSRETLALAAAGVQGVEVQRGAVPVSSARGAMRTLLLRMVIVR